MKEQKRGKWGREEGREGGREGGKRSRYTGRKARSYLFESSRRTGIYQSSVTSSDQNQTNKAAKPSKVGTEG